MTETKLVKKFPLFVILIMVVTAAQAQIISADNLLSITSLATAKIKPYITKKSFHYTGKERAGDTTLGVYQYIKEKSKNDTVADLSLRLMNVGEQKIAGFIIYQTSDTAEFHVLIEQFKKIGFYTNESADSLETTPLLFQHNEFVLRTFFTVNDTTRLFNISIAKMVFPNAKDIAYADDMLAFTSHEALVYYFGKKNVKTDVYFFTDNEVNRCSVLFLNTSRQVVYIWKDDINKYGIDHLLFGGQQKLASAKESDHFVAENSWIFKSGLHAGMTLFELLKLNETDFRYYGTNSVNAGQILPENNGKLDFKKENVVLSCINCNDDKFSTAPVISANDALSGDKILFVLTVALSPGK